ncbi:cysteine hydrolase family protein [Chitinophaga nivalis]|uniref:Cysteine hydrolase n=1 Tax=Chitinophaga nivalis TaxID=2991709 RepID=A0ABT3IPL1_9BACT|nr:isochorismatase family cysteine hydrolase [Chitinophaga nivalis]MCW3464395.1 cysteine hydrolase [Chitinophaga nivalis]MCW3485914.1 cysteine hydrolase [Chitinophaga nivalis]
MGNQVIVIIDVQKDFTGTDSPYARRHGSIHAIRQATTLIQQLLDTPKDTPFLVTQSAYRPNQFGPGLSMCIPGTPGHDLDLQLNTPHTIVVKNEHSCFTAPDFIRYLQDHQIDTLLLCGLLAEYCVKQTALDALNQGYKIILLQDYISTGDDVQERKMQTLQALQQRGAIIQ